MRVGPDAADLKFLRDLWADSIRISNLKAAQDSWISNARCFPELVHVVRHHM